MVLDPITIAVAFAVVFLISFTKGALGGGFAIIGIPLLALVMDPITAGALLAPLFCVMDLVALRYWRPSTWSKPDLIVLVPTLLIGMGLGYLFIGFADRRFVAIAIAIITLTFAVMWFTRGSRIVQRPRSTAKGALAGVTSGIASMIAHAGGPPAAMYLLPLGLPAAVYAGTTFLYFVVSNVVKVGPWLAVAELTPDFWLLMALTLPAIPMGTWTGWRLHGRLDQRQLYAVFYALLIVVALKLLWDGVAGYLPR
jgi:uncharacterized membrane protein YfcA